MPEVRSAARGLVVVDGMLLVIVLAGKTGEEIWLTPGGGQSFGETKTENVVREVFEETGYRVCVGELACGRDYIGAHHFPEQDSHAHQTELWFWCSPVEGVDPVVAEQPDGDQTGILWVPLDELTGSPLYPRRLASWLNEDPQTRPLWLGDVN